MKQEAYKCNLCGHVNLKSMHSLVKNQDHSRYLLSDKDDSNLIHICESCIDLLDIGYANTEKS